MEKDLDAAALEYHQFPTPGKISVVPTKGLTNQRDLALAYSPGVAAACNAIVADPGAAAAMTSRSNLVGVVTNGTAVLGLGNIGPLAAKPVMEGKACLFKKFSGIDVFDIELAENDPDKLVDMIAALEPTFGGINLEDIKAPECFYIERKLRERMRIPVFHDDQHGTAIVVGAAVLNGLKLLGKKVEEVKLVTSGAGAAALACLDLLVMLGVKVENIWVTDLHGVAYVGRVEEMDEIKARYAKKTKARTLAEVIEGADVFLGLSAGRVLKPEMAAKMAPKPLILALANPTPEILPEEVRAVRSDAIIATGRSDYPNQVNNVLCFPFIFRGALDVQASTINEAMKVAAARALADLARAAVPDSVASSFHGRRPSFGRDYIIPGAFDPRIIWHVAPAVARAAMDSGVARRPLIDMDAYVNRLQGRLDPLVGWLQSTFEKVKSDPKRVIFAEGEDLAVIRAANSFYTQGFGQPLLVGTETNVKQNFRDLGVPMRPEYEFYDTRKSPYTEEFTEYLYKRLQRRGYLKRDCLRLVTNERNVFAALMVAHGYADAMVSGVTRNWTSVYRDVMRVIEPAPERKVIGITLALIRGRAVIIADTSIHNLPTAEELAYIAEEAARAARNFGIEPRVAFLAYSTFGQPRGERSDEVREAVAMLDERGVDFEYDGDMAADVALNKELMKLYPFCRLSDTANVLIMPAFHAASISTKMLRELGGATIIGPLLTGLSKSVQICSLGARDTDIVNMAALAAYDVSR